MFDDGYKDCILTYLMTRFRCNKRERGRAQALLKIKYLIRMANYRDAWIVRVPARHPGALPFQSLDDHGKW